MERAGDYDVGGSDHDPPAAATLPPAATELPGELMKLWEVDLGETPMAVIFRPGPGT